MSLSGGAQLMQLMSRRRPFVRAVLAFLALSASCVFAQSVAVRLDGAGFAQGPAVSQLKVLAVRLLEGRDCTVEHLAVRLEGTSEACNAFVTLQGLRCPIGGEILELRSVSCRIPVGNVRLLASDRLRWPESFLLKDVLVTIDGRSLARVLSASSSQWQCRVVAPDGTVKVDLARPSKASARRRLVAGFYDASLALEGGFDHVRNARALSLLFGTGALPAVLGARRVSWFAQPVVGVGGRLAVRCEAAIVSGKFLRRTPETYLLERSIAAHLDEVHSAVDQAMHCRSFFHSVRAAARDEIALSGVVLLGVMEQLPGLFLASGPPTKYRIPGIEVNPLR